MNVILEYFEQILTYVRTYIWSYSSPVFSKLEGLVRSSSNFENAVVSVITETQLIDEMSYQNDDKVSASVMVGRDDKMQLSFRFSLSSLFCCPMPRVVTYVHFCLAST